MSAGGAHRVFLSLGSNLGDRARYLSEARASLVGLPGTSLVAHSRIYETAPQDLVDQPPYLNQVVCVETELEPRALLAAVQTIEKELGRVRGPRFGPRTLDIDILLFEDVESEDPELTLPHPRMRQRAFVMVPLREIWDWARGMPALDVDSLATGTAGSQAVRVHDTGA